MDREYFNELVVYMKGVALLSMGVPINLPLVLPENLDKLPIIVFSHGLLVSMEIYTFICSDLASHGYLVVAVNHNDGSLPITYYVGKDADSEMFCKKWVKNPCFTPFGSPGERPSKYEKVEIRVKEIGEVMNSLEMLNEGRLSNMLYPDIDLMHFQGRLSMDKAVVMGHSLGGATAIACLASDIRIGLAVTLDPSMEALHEKYIRQRIDKPMLIINCSGKDRDAKVSHAMGIRLLDADVTGTTAERLSVILLGTTHLAQTDLCFLPQRNLQSLNIVAKNDAMVSNSINTKLILGFVGKYLGFPAANDIASILQQEKYFVKVGTDYDEIDEADVAAAKNRVMSLQI